MTHIEFAQSSTPPDPLVSSVSIEGETTVVSLRGEADRFSLPVIGHVLARVIADHDGPVIIDLAELAFIDASGIHALARAAAFLGDRGRELTLRTPSRMTNGTLAFAGLADAIEPANATVRSPLIAAVDGGHIRPPDLSELRLAAHSGPRPVVRATRKVGAPWA